MQTHRMAPRRRSDRKDGQAGQALTEFLVASIALVPLFLLLPMIGKYQDLSHATMLASRYVAFEATQRNDTVNAWKPEAQLAQEVRRRFFSNSDAPIKTGDAAGNFFAHRNGHWVDVRGNPLLPDIDNAVNVSFGDARSAVHGGAFSGSSSGMPFALASRFGLRARDIYTANVSVRVANLPAGLRFIRPFDTLNLEFTRSTSLLLDTWAERGPDQVQDRLGDSFINPVRTISSSRGMVDLAVRALDGDLIGLGSIRGPRLGELRYWQDTVPENRLRN